MRELMAKLKKAPFFLVCLAATWAACQARQGCLDSDFVGTYAFQAFGFDLRSQPPAPMALSGVVRPDGQGGFLAWSETVAFLIPENPNKQTIPSNLLEAAAAAGSELRYEVDPNCQMRIFGSVMTPFGPVALELVGGLADGGRKALLQLGSPFAIGTWTAESEHSSQPGRRGF